MLKINILKKKKKKKNLPKLIRNQTRNPHLLPATFVKILQTTNQFALDRLSFLIFINNIIITIIVILMIAIMTVIIAIQIKLTSTGSGVTVPASAIVGGGGARSAEKLSENIISVTRIIPERRRIIPLGELKSFLAVLVVDLTLVSVAENVVSFGDLLELSLRLFLIHRRILVRMPLHRQFPVRFLQVFVARAPIHLQYVVVVHSHGR